ncbi:MAG: protein phosphatase 2C domain-containing protein [Bifidobacteriaceae bacterium]|nr:protein phosphatase 2C domain-containing protein [Bifidobacteriaceae bacterium]
MVEVAAAALTHRGRVRPVNEDSVIAKTRVFAVADGMGGHRAGDLASAVVAEEMERLAATAGPISPKQVDAAVTAARTRLNNMALFKLGRQAGATLSGAVLVGHEPEPQWLIVNLGDSRTYRYAEGQLTQLTVDHSRVAELLAAGQITDSQARYHPERHVVTKALGAGAEFTPDYSLIPVTVGDRLLICSDGLTNEVDDAQIATFLATFASPQSAAQALLDAALSHGGADNISVVIVDVTSLAQGADGTPEEDTDPHRQADAATVQFRTPAHQTTAAQPLPAASSDQLAEPPADALTTSQKADPETQSNTADTSAETAK